jgi:DNA polymerase-3 subunit epsilon
MQRSFDDLGTPLHEVMFCVVDLETTGGSPIDCGITEVAAVKFKGGHCLGTFATLVNPGALIPPAITVLTGITQSMVLPAPRIDQVLPSFLEFVHGTVIVGHNIRFDLSFLNAALDREGYPKLPHRSIDTCALARRLVADEVPNHRLGTLADRLRLDHKPTHRALDDVLATADLLHVLLERAGSLGVLGLDDLLELPTVKGHPQLAKLKLTDALPRTPGVYRFRDAGGRVLYVGKATNLRSRVRSYFSGDERRKVGQLLRETAAIDHTPTATPLEAAVLEVRLIHEHLPRFNRQAKTWSRYAYLKLTLNERWPRLSVVRSARDDGALYLGPLPTTAAAKKVADAIECAVPIRRCTKTPPKVPRSAPCAPAQLGVSSCPCAAAVTDEEYRQTIERVVAGLTVEPAVLLQPLADRMHAMAAAERFEEAAELRDRASALASALARQRRLDGLRRAGRVVLDLPGGIAVELDGGRLLRAWAGDAAPLALHDRDAPVPLSLPLPRSDADEVACIAAWLDKEAHRVRVVSCDGELASPASVLPRFTPVESKVGTKVLLRPGSGTGAAAAPTGAGRALATLGRRPPG